MTKETNMKHGKYDDIIDLPHHQSETRPHMTMRNRGAQFAPFAALTGYGEMIDDAVREYREAYDSGDESESPFEDG